MGCIRQMQRRAIEALRDSVADKPLPPIRRGMSFLADYDGRPLFPLGVSVGVGTCSDIYGVNVLVLGHEPCDDRLNEDGIECEYAVLLRQPTEQEWQNSDISTRSALCVERLVIRQTLAAQIVVLAKTGINAVYAKI